MRTTALIITLATLAGCVPSQSSNGIVEYAVVGTAHTARLTYRNPYGSVEQLANVRIPWTYRMTGVDFGQPLYISAQNTSGDGIVTVLIRKDGREYKSASSEGAHVIASASGTY